MGKKRIQPNYRRRTLRLPDLDHSKLAVLNSLGSPGSRRVYEFALNQFIAWYCSEPRLAFNRIVVTRYRMYLESRHLAANTINQQLAAVRRLAHEAADAGLLSPGLAAGISRVKGVKQLGFRSGNWLSAEQTSEVLKQTGRDTMRAKRDYAMLAMLFGCGFRRSELVSRNCCVSGNARLHLRQRMTLFLRVRDGAAGCPMNLTVSSKAESVLRGSRWGWGTESAGTRFATRTARCLMI